LGDDVVDYFNNFLSDDIGNYTDKIYSGSNLVAIGQ